VAKRSTQTATLHPLPVGEDDALMPSLLTLSDVMGTGHHAAVVAKVGPGKRVGVVGDGAVGLCGVIAAKRLGAEPAFFANVTVGGGPAPVRAYIEELLPDVLEGRIDPGRVFDRTVDLDGVPDGYRAMADRESTKVMVNP
jgi:threonine dehydrogenase-like Zn-dependent dehydrogenase